MQSFIVFASVLACALAAPQAVFHSGIGAPFLHSVVAPALTSSQYHAQDELGQYSYGYAGGPSAKAESKDAFGNVRGGYSYVDANGITQTVNYVADPVNGFRVAATNLPVGPAAPVATPLAAPVHHFSALPVPVQDTPEVAAAKAQHFAAHAEALIRSA